MSENNAEAKAAFEGENARNYDKTRARLMAVKDALHFCMKHVLATLPVDARILCVGAGTGDELFALADMFPTARFTVVEPSAGMVAVCRDKAAARGVEGRCHFHTGYLDSLEDNGPFDAATAILVSQFCVVYEERVAFFRGIADRLHKGGILVNADLSADLKSAEFQGLWSVWATMLHGADMPPGTAEKFLEAAGRGIAVSTDGEIKALLTESGLEDPVHFFQFLMIHGWFSRKPE
ncbi:class I SAM-dependent methyltransferase [Kordiimonas aestuarii]|uniref:class I SAM-dependent methyltransferase n=1 Tax=Kordiimonas aestuarii TaxID=1005925 RepID=UPI0021CFC653|nr:class I SAM-dependent methyltransferase [Kordiimonas aestuarii]